MKEIEIAGGWAHVDLLHVFGGRDHISNGHFAVALWLKFALLLRKKLKTNIEKKFRLNKPSINAQSTSDPTAAPAWHRHSR